MKYRRLILWAGVLVLGLSARFALETALVDRLPAALSVAVALVPAALVVAAVSFRVQARRPLESRDRLMAAAVGVGGVWLTPFLVALARHSDAPPGSEVLFLTTVVWGALLVLAGLALVPPSTTAARIVAALLAVAAAVAILANWERPSSFSPFVRYRMEETVMVGAGVVWALAVVVLQRLVRRHGPLVTARAVALPAAAAAILAAVMLAPARLPDLLRAEAWTLAAPAAGATVAVLLGWVLLLDELPPHRIAAAYFLPPVALTALSVVERTTFAFGPNPMVVGPVLAGVALTIAAVAVLAVRSEDSGADRAPSCQLLAARALSLVAVTLAVAGLALPDLLVSVTGTLSSGDAFSTTFAMSGYETVGGWLALCCALLAGAWAWSPAKVNPDRWLLWLAALAVAAVAWVPVHTTPTHVLNGWIPPEVQQDYGTEYASRKALPVSGPWEPAAVVAALCSGALLSFERRGSAVTALRGQEVSKA